MTIRTIGAALLVAASLAGCANIDSGPYASPEEVARAAYRHDGPPELTLYTMVSNRSGAGAHTSLMVNASQRVIFDPSGSVQFADTPELNDVLYGITPAVAEAYKWTHARETYHLRLQRIEVSPEVAERALRLVQQNGPVGASACTQATSAILSQLPGFESVGTVLFPVSLADRFGALPGVTEELVYDDDADDKALAVERFDTEGAVR